jgi:hypothetical protein
VVSATDEDGMPRISALTNKPRSHHRDGQLVEEKAGSNDFASRSSNLSALEAMRVISMNEIPITPPRMTLAARSVALVAD